MDLCKVHATGKWVCRRNTEGQGLWALKGGEGATALRELVENITKEMLMSKQVWSGKTLVIPRQESDYDTVYTGMIWGQGRTMNFYSLPTLYFDCSEHLWVLLPRVCYFWFLSSHPHGFAWGKPCSLHVSACFRSSRRAGLSCPPALRLVSGLSVWPQPVQSASTSGPWLGTWDKDVSSPSVHL